MNTESLQPNNSESQEYPNDYFLSLEQEIKSDPRELWERAILHEGRDDDSKELLTSLLLKARYILIKEFGMTTLSTIELKKLADIAKDIVRQKEFGGFNDNLDDYSPNSELLMRWFYDLYGINYGSIPTRWIVWDTETNEEIVLENSESAREEADKINYQEGRRNKARMGGRDGEGNFLVTDWDLSRKEQTYAFKTEEEALKRIEELNAGRKSNVIALPEAENSKATQDVYEYIRRLREKAHMP
ncbi:MAG: hypothetical protein WC027_02505 [Candidatus Paceibacterota bacterium]